MTEARTLPAVRIEVIDAVRGFALVGVIMSNVAVVWGSGAGQFPASTADRWVGEIYAYLLTGRFLGLFSLLFGISFGLYLHQSRTHHGFNAARYLRRLCVLFLIGVANRVLFGPDILMTYAALGGILLLMRSTSDRAVVIGIVLGFALPFLAQAILDVIGYQPSPPPVPRAERLRLAAEGEYASLVLIRFRMLLGWWRELLTRDSAYVAIFLFGLLVTRRHVFAPRDVQLRQLRVVLVAGIGATVLGFLVQEVLRPHLGSGSWLTAPAFGVVWLVTAFVQATAYGAALGLLWARGGTPRRLMRALTPAGRLSLTNYIVASLIATILVLSSGSFGRVGVTSASVIGLTIWGLSLWWSASWLRRYQVGPLEWLWRRLA